MNEFEKLFSLIHEGKKPNIEYSKFKDILTNYIESLMKGIVQGKANYVCRIKPLDKGHHGSEGYDENSNTYVVIISENITQSIYTGTNPFNIFTIFHELSHVFDEYNIKNRDFHDANLKKICIEMGLIRATALGDLFYIDNYKSVAIEAHANLLGSQLTRDFYEKCNID